MQNPARSPAQEALLRTIAEKRKTDPLIGAKLGAKEMFRRLTETMKTEKGVQIESLLCALGALAGYACQASVVAIGSAERDPAKKPQLVVANGADGKRYFFGDALNKPLAESQYSVWGLAAGAAQSLGCKDLPDVQEIFAHVAKTVGGADFGIPRISEGHKPSGLPVDYLKALWPSSLSLAREMCATPAEWPILFGLAIQDTMDAAKGVIGPKLALVLVMESAIPASKVELKWPSIVSRARTENEMILATPRNESSSDANLSTNTRSPQRGNPNLHFEYRWFSSRIIFVVASVVVLLALFIYIAIEGGLGAALVVTSLLASAVSYLFRRTSQSGQVKNPLTLSSSTVSVPRKGGESLTLRYLDIDAINTNSTGKVAILTISSRNGSVTLNAKGFESTDEFHSFRMELTKRVNVARSSRA